MHATMHSHLLEEEEMESFMQELLALLQTSLDVADICEVLQAIEEKAPQIAKPGTSHALGKRANRGPRLTPEGLTSG
jgi:hypothetical protein